MWESHGEWLYLLDDYTPDTRPTTTLTRYRPKYSTAIDSFLLYYYKYNFITMLTIDYVTCYVIPNLCILCLLLIIYFIIHLYVVKKSIGNLKVFLYFFHFLVKKCNIQKTYYYFNKQIQTRLVKQNSIYFNINMINLYEKEKLI